MDEHRCWGLGSMHDQVVQQAQQKGRDSTVQQTNWLGRALTRAAGVWSQQGLQDHACDETPSIRWKSVRCEQQ